MAALQFLFGLVLLVAGAEAVVRGASRLSALLGVTPLVIGLTVVAYGTSAPELAVSVRSALEGGDIAAGNVLGSNIFNLLFILGAAALVRPLSVAQRLVRVDVPLLVAVSAAVWILSADGAVSRMEGIALVAGGVAYTAFAVRSGRREACGIHEEYRRQLGNSAVGPGGVSLNVLLTAGGLVLLVVGAGRMVDGAVEIARFLGVGELVIGLTIVAVGTSAPEVATSILAAIRGERDIAVGNVVGSNLFNLLGVLGVASVVAPSGVRVAPAAVAYDFPVTLAASVLCLPFLISGFVLSRAEGGLLLGCYAAYACWLALGAQFREPGAPHGTVFLIVVAVATGILLLVGLWIQRRRDGSLHPLREGALHQPEERGP
jgi:cation:H+ antiporter